MTNDLKVVKCSDDHWQTIGRWTVEEEWDWSHNESWSLLRRFPNTTILVAANHQDETMGCLMFTKPPEWKHANVMFFITHAEHRGQGIGKFLWKHMLEDLGNTPLMIHSVYPTTDMYKNRFGFIHIDPFPVWSIKVKQGKLRAAAEEWLKESAQDTAFLVQPFDKSNHAAPLMEYDRKISKRDRAQSVLGYLDMSVTNTAVGLDGAKVVGFCCMSNAKKGRVDIGPYYAENMAMALKLLCSVMEVVSVKDSEEITFSVPETNGAFYKFVRDLKDGGEESVPFYTSFTEPFEHMADWSKVYCQMITQPDC